MNFRDYCKLTKGTTISCIKICGVVFTSICVFIAIVFGYKNESFTDAIEICIICFLLGNVLGFLIWFLAITTAYRQVKTIIKFYDSIPNEIIEQFGLELMERPQNSRYYFLQLDLLDTKSAQQFLYRYDKKNVCITMINDSDNIENFQKRMFEIKKKYKKEHIILDGWGLSKIIKWKDWQKITSEEVRFVLERLRTVCEEEDLGILNRNDEYDE